MAHRRIKHIAASAHKSQPRIATHFESELEHRAYLHFKYRKDVRAVTIQPPQKVRFIDRNGAVAHFGFNLCIETADGQRIAVVARHSSRKAADQLARLERTGRLLREDGSLGSIKDAFDMVTFVTTESLDRAWQLPGSQGKLAAAE